MFLFLHLLNVCVCVNLAIENELYLSLMLLVSYILDLLLYIDFVHVYTLSIAYDPSLQFRANLDPEMFRVVNKYKSINKNKDEI